MASARAAYRDGVRRVARAPAVFAGLLAALTLLTAPAAWLVRDALVRAFGASLIASDLARGFDLRWWRELSSRAEGLVADVAPSIIGFAAVLRNLSAFTDPSDASDGSWLIVAFWFLTGVVLSGGILDRYARQRALHTHGFFAACGRLAFRLLRLNVLVLLVYATVLSIGWLIVEPVWTWLTRDLASERAAFAWGALFTGAAALVVGLVTIVADCARVRMVVEDRRSALFALIAGFRFARRAIGRLIRLYALLLATTLACFAIYAIVAPGATLTGLWVWAGFFVSEVYIAARVFTKLLTYASVTSLFQSELAHADYVAQPAPIWPESPAVESLGLPTEAAETPGLSRSGP
jgi:hypothetical protein